MGGINSIALAGLTAATSEVAGRVCPAVNFESLELVDPAPFVAPRFLPVESPYML